MSVHVHLLATRVDDGWRCSLHSALQVDRDALVSGAEPPAVCLTLDGPDGWVLTAVTCGSHVRTHAERDDPDELLSSLTAAGIDDPDGAILDPGLIEDGDGVGTLFGAEDLLHRQSQPGGG